MSVNVDVRLCTESRLKQIEVELKWYQFLFTFQSTQHISNCIINKGEVPELKVQLRKHFINRQLNMMMGTWEVIPQFGVSFCFPSSYLSTLFAVCFTSSIYLVSSFHDFSPFATSLLFSLLPLISFLDFSLLFSLTTQISYLTNFYLNYKQSERIQCINPFYLLPWIFRSLTKV